MSVDPSDWKNKNVTKSPLIHTPFSISIFSKTWQGRVEVYVSLFVCLFVCFCQKGPFAYELSFWAKAAKSWLSSLYLEESQQWEMDGSLSASIK